MAKRKKKKTRADKEAEVKGAKKTAKLAGKEAAAHKPTEAKAEPKAKAKTRAKPKAKSKAKSEAKSKSNLPSDIENPLAQIDKPVDISKEVDIGKPDSEILTENLESPQTDDRIGDVAEAILEADAEAESHEGKEGSLQTGDEQTSIVVETENPDTAESISQEAVDTQTDKLTDDVPESVVEANDTTENATEKKDDFQADKQTNDPTEVDIESSDTEIFTDDLDAQQTGDQAGDVTEAILESVAEAESPEGKEGNLQTGDEQTSIVVEAETSDTAESISQEAVDIQTDNLTDDASGPVVDTPDTAESATEKKDDSQANKQADDSTKVEAPQTDDQTDEITDAILDAAAETERLTEEAENLQTEDEQTSILVEAEDSDTAESLSQKTEDTQTDKPEDDVSDSIAAQIPTEKIDDTSTGDQPGDVIEDPDTTKSHIEKADDNQTGEVIEVAAEVEKLAEEVDGLQTEDEQTGILVEAEDSDTAESLSKEAEETQADKLTDDVSESVVEGSVDVENPTEEIDDTKTDDLPGDVNEDPDAIESSMEKADDTLTDNQAGEVTEDAAESKSIVDRIKKLLSGESKTVVDRVKKFLSGIFQIGSKADDSTEEGIDSHAETESLTEGTDDTHADVQEEDVVETVIKNPEPVEDLTGSADDTLTDKQVGDTDDTQIDNQIVFAPEANVEGPDDDIQTAVYSDNKQHRTKKAGIIISVFIVTAAVILLIVASIERRSAKSALVQISKVAESIKQMQGETLKDREQVTRSQIESKELVIDALSLTRNGLELERANSDEVEVKRIIGVFINDIDERITKIKGNIVLLRNKLKEAD